jgi:hypothetical protein
MSPTGAMREDHADQVVAIYRAGIDPGNPSSETTAPIWNVFDAAKPADHCYTAVETARGDLCSPWPITRQLHAANRQSWAAARLTYCGSPSYGAA